MLAVGVRSHYKWEALVLFLTEKEQVFLISHGPSIQNTNISFWLVITLFLQRSPKCSSCCEFLVSSQHFVLSPFVLAGVFEDLLKVVFFLLYVWNLLAALTRVSESLMCPVVHAEVWCWESWLRLYPVAGDVSWWTGGERLCSVWGQLCLRSLRFMIITMKAKSCLCVCMRAYCCATPPNLWTPLWPALNCCLPIFSSSPPSARFLVFFHLTLYISLHRLSVLPAVPRLCRNVSAAPIR